MRSLGCEATTDIGMSVSKPPEVISLKACPILLRPGSSGAKILAFRHPSAGCQLVKGTVEDGESLEAAAVREMLEEGGITVTV